ncbi:golgin subfamily A member 5-like [Dendronephthya gigantea]|uniref:golgin subfamily A member 5-like n=1 Tax=Dendronephthya gigantea TaxID=151771 RepID=UPI00106A4998|nr:golgin subfamily A member 5-like [Dendronephthya gigantea]
MSWLVDLAGKAESFLDNIDKKAADVVGSDPGSNNVNTAPGHTKALEVERNISRTNDNPLAGRPSGSNVSATNIINRYVGRPSSPKPKTSTQAPRTSTQTSSNRKNNDDELFEFLNKGSADADRKKITRQLRSSSPVQTSSPKMPKLENDENEQKKRDSTASGYFPEGETSYQSDDSVDVIDASPEQSSERIVATKLPEVETLQTMESKAGRENVEQPARVSNLELENKLLRKEVDSLNEELVSLHLRSKEAQERVLSAERDSERLNEQLKKEGKFIREFRSREDDLRETLGAKDSQLAVLRVRIQESDQELRQTKEKLERFQNENERILRDHSDSSGIQNQVLEDLRTRLQEAQLALKHEQESHQQSRTESSERQSKFESEQRSMAETVKTLQKNIVEEKRNANDCTNKLKACENKLSSANQEFRDYKEKAGRILQAKEKVITSLKEGKAIVGDSSGITSAEYEAVCQERDVVRDELHQAKYNMEQLKVDIQELEQQLQSENETAQEQTDHLQSLLDEEKRLKDEANHDVLKAREELQTLSDDHYRQKTTLIAQIQERDGEVEKLKSQLLAKSYTTTSEAELEKRVRALTENLIQKQTVIEALSTEKSSLVLQLERLEMQYKDIQRSTSRVSVPTAFVENDEGGRVRPITSIMPSQISESAKVNKAVNEIDKFSIRLGVFLRRYPIARLMLIVYMILLHLWVFIVLLTYQPEVHSSSPAGPMPNNPHSK